MNRLTSLAGAAALMLAAGNTAAASFGEQLEGFPMPYPLQHFTFSSQQQRLSMGYMDVRPAGKANGHVVVLLHGKNFCGATWESTLRALSQQGYRVIAPDQIGFCTSTKPAYYHYSFQQLADNTRRLLQSLNVEKATIVGHSTGGMLATRYALMYPQQTEKLVMVNPIGLEDWKAKGAPWRSVDDWYQRELKLTAEGIKKYERQTYYAGRWKPEYDRWVEMLAGLNSGPGQQKVAWNSALIYDMIYSQPVWYELPDLRVPTTLFIGTADTTAIGSDIAPPQVKARLGDYKVLGKAAAKRIPDARLVEFDGMGHAPQMEAPDRFNQALIKDLTTLK
ncbi:4,5:9,10-diseco-3-hydroxy-5,9,17-trioxoandrosta-1(10),2-diene-4-oate hydrolase [Mixta theicola]|nr:alpha/beta hydrolase [Mixta theicola]QHM77289.1 4,5:9,10-diseco-3-hydroxy-5,9,17-trioxoandrosta-1(10),2-diene-4-oate hydrolase [Mixta theicola]